MKIKVIYTPDEDNWGQYAGVMTELTTKEGILSIDFAGGIF